MSFGGRDLTRIGVLGLAAVAMLLASVIPCTAQRTPSAVAGNGTASPASYGLLPVSNRTLGNPKSPIQNRKLVESYDRLLLSFEANHGQPG